MNEQIRKEVVKLLKINTFRSEDALLFQISKDISVDSSEVRRTIQLMGDAGEITFTGTNPPVIRLTLKGDRLNEPQGIQFKRYMFEYLSTHWLAIIAVIISLVALFIRK